MPLPTVSLDDRRFQDIVDHAKRLIPQYCPEWTDHNVSDPGVTLIELFAWMTEMLLYRVNQVPEKMYIKFLELIGVRLEPPRAARASVTFYLSAPQPKEETVRAGTEVATLRTETDPAIIFTTETDLVIRPPVVTGAMTRNYRPGGASEWIAHDLRQLDLPGRQIDIFPSDPEPDDAFYIALERDHSHHVLALVFVCDEARGVGIDPDDPPIEWQVWQGHVARWAPCELEADGTGGFSYERGEVVLHLPPMTRQTFEGLDAFWLRCRLTEAQAEAHGYQVPPSLKEMNIEARGGTAPARHAMTINNEDLGESDGTPGQSFKLRHTPILARDSTRDHLVVTLPGHEKEVWHEVADFAESGPEDRHFTLDSLDGTLTLAPSLLQPDGSVYRFGAIPPKGSKLRFSRYQHGGGIVGNVPVGALAVLKSSISYIAQVTNRTPATGGRDAQNLEDAKLRAPQTLRTRARAVTADDYEHLSLQVPGVARARCLSPGAQPGVPGDPRPGEILIVILPQTELRSGPVPPERLVPSAELRNAVLEKLDGRRLLGTTLEVWRPEYVWVTVSLLLRIAERNDAALAAQVQERAAAELYRYLNPYVGGPAGNGWPFGRDLHVSEIYSLIQRIPEVEFIEELKIGVSEPGSAQASRPAPPRLSLPPHGVICSAEHRVVVQ